MLLVVASLLLLQAMTSSANSQVKTFEIADGVYSFTPDGTYISMFIVTGDGVIAIEPVNTQHSKAMLQAIQNVTAEPVKYLFYSHNHWDHSGGGQVFKDAGATIMAHEEAYDWLENNLSHDVILPDEKWTGKQKDITLGSTKLELRYLGANHGLGNTVFVTPAARVPITGILNQSREGTKKTLKR